MQQDIGNIAMQMALRAAGHSFQPTAELGNPQMAIERSIRVPGDNRRHSFALLDITKTNKGEYHLIEANGSNGALTSTATGNDKARARHMYDTLRSRTALEGKSAIVLPYQPGFSLTPEFYRRAQLFTEMVAEECVANLRQWDEEFGDEQVAIICGSIPDLCEHIHRQENRLAYRDRTIIFATNPNIMVELLRRQTVSYNGGTYDIDTTVFHEGCLVPIIHNKALQQEIACDTGITPLRWAEAWNVEECVSIIHTFHKSGMVAVGKMNAGSGGAGIEIFPPSSLSKIRTTLQDLINSAVRKYGADVESTLFPIRVFEFARSTDYYIEGRAHLWDMRVMALIRPEYTDLTPLAIRLCPEPFDESTYHRDGVVSNRTGRAPSLKFMRSALDQSALSACEISTNELSTILESCARWCHAALVAATTEEQQTRASSDY